MKNPEKEAGFSQLLSFLIKSLGRVFTTEQLIAAVVNYTVKGNLRLLKHLVSRLRQKLEDNPKNAKYIQTEAGIGYKLLVE